MKFTGQKLGQKILEEREEHDRDEDASPPHVQAGRLSLRVRSACEAVGEFIEYWGFKAIHGRIWAILALHAEPMSQVDIADFLGVSRSLVSGAMSELTDHGLVEAVGTHRNAPYRAVFDIWPSIAGVLRSREWMLIEGARVALEGAIEEYELTPAAERRGFSVERMQFLLRLTEMAQAFLRLLIGIRMPRQLDGVGDWLRTSSALIKSLRSLR
jgi:DNA-binding transcriptional regulator GbsR (MarR family)